METDWREQLKEQVHEFHKRKALQKSSDRVPIVIPVELSESELNKLSAFVGWCNSTAFGEAEEGTIEIQGTGRGSKGTGYLSFVLRKEPPPHYRPSHEVLGRHDLGSKDDEIHPGVNFNTIPDFVFATDREELELMSKGQRSSFVVPLSPRAALDANQDPCPFVTFFQTSADFWGSPLYAPGGDFLTVKPTKIEDLDRNWVNYRLHLVTWDAQEIERRKVARDLCQGTEGKGSRKYDG